ncbi:hypothetical protein NKJ84_28280 [Mesorhizobium sp. M0048]|uniref:hypothetical protein n=1 Tax=Mesorhizobium sp. M0048 TaxID=2956860 RepID=UPI00333512F9
MTISRNIKLLHIDDLYLDPLNPRLGRSETGANLRQSKILNLMKGWTLDELATSFTESGFWPQEALIVVHEELYGQDHWVVVEGNRRLAALKNLYMAAQGEAAEPKWSELAEGLGPSDPLFTEIPTIEISDRKDVESFLGFRHVTGIKEWKPAEKAQFIARLIEERGMSYEDVRRKIGSKTPTVRQNYISYRLLLQMEGEEEIALEEVEKKFSVLFLSLRTQGVRKYLDIDIQAEPDRARRPVPKHHLDNLRNFALWLFGDKRRLPVVRESRQVDDFGKILESKKAVEYLERSERPNFDVAWQLAGGDEPEIVRLVEEAADNISFSLSRAHRYNKSKKLKAAVERLATDFAQLLTIFPDSRAIICDGDVE